MKINIICFILLGIIIYIPYNILLGQQMCESSSKFLLKKIEDFYLLSNINENMEYMNLKTKILEIFNYFKKEFFSMKDNLKTMKTYIINYCHKCVTFEKNLYSLILKKIYFILKNSLFLDIVKKNCNKKSTNVFFNTSKSLNSFKKYKVNHFNVILLLPILPALILYLFKFVTYLLIWTKKLIIIILNNSIMCVFLLKILYIMVLLSSGVTCLSL